MQKLAGKNLASIASVRPERPLANRHLPRRFSINILFNSSRRILPVASLRIVQITATSLEP
jgi:hypothetical protein